MSDKLIGPVLPEDFPKEETKDEKASTPADRYGPALPPNFQNKNENVIPCSDQSDDTEHIGPILPNSSKGNVVQEALEERAQRLKYEFLFQNSCDSTDQPKRESWMTELPPEKAEHLGLGPRKFKKSYSSSNKGDRSGWTETPSDKKKKITEEETVVDHFEAASIEKRNKIMDDIVKKSKKHKKGKKSLSLLELHEKKLKKKKKKSKKNEKPERRPFDREVDLHVNRFDEAQKKAIIKKAQQLDTRFSAGKSKYL